MKRALTLFTSLALAAPAFLGGSVAAAQVPGIFQTGPEALMQRADSLFGRGERDDRDDDDDRDHDRDDGFRGDDGRVDWRNGADPRFGQDVDPRYGEVETQAPMRHRRMRPTPVQRIAQVASFLRGPGRSVRGLYLTDGSLVMLRNADMFLARRLQPGSFVRVRGVTLPNNPTTILRATVSAMRRIPRGYAAQPMPSGPIYGQPAPVPPVYAPPAPAATWPQLSSAQGVIRSVLGDANGRPQTIILSNGTRLAIPAAIAQSLGQRGLRTGETISFWAQRAHENATPVLTALQLSDGSVFRTAMPGFAR